MDGPGASGRIGPVTLTPQWLLWVHLITCCRRERKRKMRRDRRIESDWRLNIWSGDVKMDSSVASAAVVLLECFERQAAALQEEEEEKKEGEEEGERQGKRDTGSIGSLNGELGDKQGKMGERKTSKKKRNKKFREESRVITQKCARRRRRWWWGRGVQWQFHQIYRWSSWKDCMLMSECVVSSRKKRARKKSARGKVKVVRRRKRRRRRRRRWRKITSLAMGKWSFTWVSVIACYRGKKKEVERTADTCTTWHWMYF